MPKNDNEIAELDRQMKEAGMIPLSVMLNTPPFGKFTIHKGVDNLDLFEQWIDMRYVEMMKMKSRMLLAGQEDYELYEWVLSHAAVLGEVRNTFKACRGS